MIQYVQEILFANRLYKTCITVYKSLILSINGTSYWLQATVHYLRRSSWRQIRHERRKRVIRPTRRSRVSRRVRRRHRRRRRRRGRTRPPCYHVLWYRPRFPLGRDGARCLRASLAARPATAAASYCSYDFHVCFVYHHALEWKTRFEEKVILVANRRFGLLKIFFFTLKRLTFNLKSAPQMPASDPFPIHYFGSKD